MCTDVTTNKIKHQTVVFYNSPTKSRSSEQMRSPSVEEIEDQLVFDGKRSRKYEDINQPKEQIKSEDKLDSMLSLIQSSLKEISNKQEKYDRSLEEIRSQVGIGNPTIVSSLNPSGSLNFPQTPIAMGPSYVTSQYRPQFPPQYVPTDFFSPVQGKAQIPATTMGNQGQSPNLKKLRRESESGEYIAKLLSWSLYNAEWKDDVLKKILDLKSGNDNLSKVVLHQVFKKSTHLLKFLLYNDWKSSDDDPIEYRHILRICLPLWMVKSAIIVRFIKLGIKAEGIKLPPSQICAFISEASVTIILNLMLSERRCNALYWLSNFIDQRILHRVYDTALSSPRHQLL